MDTETLIHTIAEALEDKFGVDMWRYQWNERNSFWIRLDDGSQFNIDIHQTKEAKS
jgi:coenzyme F420-reducing hydrogenase beta subunit